MVRKVARWHCQRNHDHLTKQEAVDCESSSDPEPKFKKGDQFVWTDHLLGCLSFRRSPGGRRFDQRPEDPKLVPIFTVVESELRSIDSGRSKYRVLFVRYLLVSSSGETITRSQTSLSNDFLRVGPGQREANRKSLYLRSHIVHFDKQYERVLEEIDQVVGTVYGAIAN